MDVLETEDLKLLHRTLEEVDKLFLLISALPECYQETVFHKLKQKLSNSNFGTVKSVNLIGNVHRSSTVETRVSSRPKKPTTKAKIFFEEVKAQATEDKIKQRSNSLKGITPVVTGTVRPCFVKLVPLQDSSETLTGTEAIPNGITTPNSTSEELVSKQNGMPCHFTGITNLSNEDVDDPGFRNSNDNENGSRRRCSSRKIKRHWKIEDSKQNRTRNYKCEECGKSFNQKSGLNVHLKRHGGIKSFNCALCDYKAVCKIEILRHMSTHTGERNYPCKMCGKSFTSDNSLRNHVKHVHVRSEKSKCSYCSFQTHSKDILKRHYLIKHTKKEQFECPVCHEIIKQKGTFVIHLRKHTGDCPYQCAVCSKSFKSSSQLSAHKRTHLPGEYSCSVCSRIFKNKHQLVRHKIIHTGEKPYSCHLCNYACNVKANITKHVRAVHKLHSFSFKGDNRKNTKPSDNPDAIERGNKAADDYLQDHTIKVGEILTVEDLKRQSKEQAEYQQKANLDVCQYNSKTENSPITPVVPDSLSNVYPFSDNEKPEACENMDPGNTISSPSLVDSYTSDILSSAVQLLNSPIQDVSFDNTDDQSKTVNETVSIPVEIGPNMYIIRVVSEQNVSL